MTGGSLWQSLDMFNEFKYVDQIVKDSLLLFITVVQKVINILNSRYIPVHVPLIHVDLAHKFLISFSYKYGPDDIDLFG